jgi:hypothetical protein
MKENDHVTKKKGRKGNTRRKKGKRNEEMGTRKVRKRKREDATKPNLIIMTLSTRIRDRWFQCSTEQRLSLCSFVLSYLGHTPHIGYMSG